MCFGSKNECNKDAPPRRISSPRPVQTAAVTLPINGAAGASSNGSGNGTGSGKVDWKNDEYGESIR